MPTHAKYILIANMDVEPSKEALFNDVYSNEHLHHMLEVDGLVAAARYRVREVTIRVGGELHTFPFGFDQPRYSAIYEIERPEVLTSQAWNDAAARGRWPEEVMPYTRNVRPFLLERIDT
jgi:hypothetical protein